MFVCLFVCCRGGCCFLRGPCKECFWSTVWYSARLTQTFVRLFLSYVYRIKLNQSTSLSVACRVYHYLWLMQVAGVGWECFLKGHTVQGGFFSPSLTVLVQIMGTGFWATAGSRGLPSDLLQPNSLNTWCWAELKQMCNNRLFGGSVYKDVLEAFSIKMFSSHFALLFLFFYFF